MSLITQKLRAVMAIDAAASEIEFGALSVTWGEIAAAVEAIERGLESMAPGLDARVGVLLRNRPAHVAAIIAVLATGRCLVTLNPLTPDAKLAEDIQRLDLPAVIGDVEDVERTALADAFSAADAGVIAIGGTDLRVAVSRPRLRTPERTSRAPGVAIEMLTSGTTGPPKRVPLTRTAFDASFSAFARYERNRSHEDAPRLRSGIVMVVNPLAHIGGIYGCIGALLAGRRIALLERFTVEAWTAAVRTHRPRVAPAVPSALRMILEGEVTREDLSSVSAIMCGTAPLDPMIVDAFRERFGVPVLGNYGATEFAGAVAGWTLADFRENWSRKRGAVGRVHPDMEARVVDEESGAELASGSEGLLELRGDQLANGGKWLRTTDRAVLDDDRFLWIRGRADNAIVRGGFKIHADDVARAINEHIAVREAAVVGIPDPRLGEIPVAAVVLRRGQTVSDVELAAHLRKRLLPYQVPTRFVFVDDLPRTPSMKPAAPALRALFDNQASERARKD